MVSWTNICYAASCFSGIIPGTISWRLRFQNDAKYLNSQKRNFLETKIQEMASKLSIQQPVNLIEIKGLLVGAQAQGNALLPAKLGIAINPELFNQISRGEQEFILAHELSHIKANDHLWGGVICGLVGALVTLALCLRFPSLSTQPKSLLLKIVGSPAAILGQVAYLFAFTLFTRWREKRADLSGASICSDQVRLAAVQHFEKESTLLIAERNDSEGSFLSRLWKRILISPEGGVRLDIFHPSFKTRANYLRSI